MQAAGTVGINILTGGLGKAVDDVKGAVTLDGAASQPVEGQYLGPPQRFEYIGDLVKRDSFRFFIPEMTEVMNLMARVN